MVPYQRRGYKCLVLPRRSVRRGLAGVPGMSTYVLFALPLHGHLPQVLQLTTALSSRGARVVCYSSAAFAGRIADAGGAWRIYPSALLDDLRYTPDFCLRLMQCAQAILSHEMPTLRRDCPAAIIYDALLPWGPAVADLLQVPAISLVPNFVCHEPVMQMLRSCRVAPRSIVDLMAGCFARAEAGRIIAELQAEFGVEVRDPGGMPLPSDPLNLVFTSRLLQPYAEALDGRYVFAGPALPPLAPADDSVVLGLRDVPLIYVSFGTVFNGDRQLFEACFEALAQLDCEVIASTGGAHMAADFPSARNVRILPFVRQSAVLQRAAVVINNGGMNTVCESLSHGVPLVVIPSTEEQDIFARRLGEIGCAIHVPRIEVHSESLVRAVSRLLVDAGPRRACGEVARSFAGAGGADLAADRIGSLTAGR